MMCGERKHPLGSSWKVQTMDRRTIPESPLALHVRKSDEPRFKTAAAERIGPRFSYLARSRIYSPRRGFVLPPRITRGVLSRDFVKRKTFGTEKTKWFSCAIFASVC